MDSEAPMREPERVAVLRLPEAIARAVARSPVLAAASYAVRSRQGDALQAGLPPNPEVGMEVENFAGSGPVSGFRASETTLLLSQRIETAGKRARRRRAAELDVGVAAWDYEAVRIDLVASVTARFFQVLAAQERVEVTEEIASIARRAAAAVEQLVRAGATPPVELTRAELEAAAVEVEVATARRALDAARAELAAMWGASRPDFDRVEGSLEATVPPPAPEMLRSRLDRNPELAGWDAEVRRLEAVVELEDARRVPDVTVGAGLRYLADPGDPALVASVALPIPVFDRNQGRRAAARADLRRARHERRAAELRLTARLERFWQEVAARHDELRKLDGALLPQAEEAYRGVQEGFARGLFRNVDVLVAGRRLAELRRQRLDAVAAYREALAELERLTATPLSPETGAAGGTTP